MCVCVCVYVCVCVCIFLNITFANTRGLSYILMYLMLLHVGAKV